MKNPYTLLFGREPEQYIDRPAEAEEIIENFNYDNPSEQIYMITGVRGSGKTVFMTEISNRLKKNSDWIIVELSSESNLLEDFASHLASENSRAEIFKKAKYFVPIRIFISGLNSASLTVTSSPISFAISIPVSSISCISPIAPLGDSIARLKLLSFLMIANIKNGSISFSSAYL